MSIYEIITVSIALIGNSIKKVTFENTTDKSMKSKQHQTTGDLVQELKEDLSHLGEDVSHLASKMDDFKKSSFKIQHALGPVHVRLSTFYFIIILIFSRINTQYEFCRHSLITLTSFWPFFDNLTVVDICEGIPFSQIKENLHSITYPATMS